MEQKNRSIIAITVTILILVAMFASFGRNLFTDRNTQVVLPPEDTTQSGSDSSAATPDHPTEFLRVEVNPQTVQSVIGSLSRNTNYYRELTVNNFWDEGTFHTTTVQVWVDNGWSHVKQTLPSGLIRHDLIGDEQVYYWYEGDDNWRTAPADQLSADLAQHIPTYETVLALDVDRIIATGYELQEELPCIYVEVQNDMAGYGERYWVSVDNGLLVRAEVLEKGAVIYSMSALSPIQSPAPVTQETFTLPDGTILHTP